jgi:hypothetical protein
MLVNVDPKEFGRIDLSYRNIVNGEDGISSRDGFPRLRESLLALKNSATWISSVLAIDSRDWIDL